MTKVAVLQQGLATLLTLGPVRVKVHEKFQASEDLESSSDVTYVFPQCLGYPPKSNMEPENDGLKQENPSSRGPPFQVNHVSFPGCSWPPNMWLNVLDVSGHHWMVQSICSRAFMHP